MILPAMAPEADAEDNAGEGMELEKVESTKDALLLYWEEKDLYVESTTRNLKPISQSAENIVVVSAREIEDMNAHTLAEVLNNVPGVFVEFQGMDFGSPALVRIQGSENRHVTTLLDGVPLNQVGDGTTAIWYVPVGIIERVEIVKGPASSAWGSALGGVINVVTKSTGSTVIPKGTVSASYGEKDSTDLRAQLVGKGGPVGYYLYAGRQSSEGINTNGFEADSFYGKVSLMPTHDKTFSVTAGYTNPMNDNGVLRGQNRTGKTMTRGFFTTASAEYQVTDDLGIKAMGYIFTNAYRSPSNRVPANTLYRELKIDEDTVGGNLRLVYSGEMHTLVAGVEASYGKVDMENRMPGRQPEVVKTAPDITKWALFANDTISVGSFSITPGLRIDHNDISGSFVSPSLGLTYQIREHTILKASVARGFTTPPLLYMSGGGRGIDPNPDLKEENVWSYQVGAESSVTEHLSMKATLFRHDLYDSLISQGTMYVNNGKVVRQGAEVGAETAPFYNLSLRAAFTFVHAAADMTPADREKSSWDTYMYNLGIKYDDRNNIMAQLTGNYVWWDLPSYYGATYDDFIWDFNGSKRLFMTGGVSGDVYVTVHNLFNSPYYTISALPNTRRWVEGGLRFKF